MCVCVRECFLCICIYVHVCSMCIYIHVCVCMYVLCVCIYVCMCSSLVFLLFVWFQLRRNFKKQTQIVFHFLKIPFNVKNTLRLGKIHNKLFIYSHRMWREKLGKRQWQRGEKKKGDFYIFNSTHSYCFGVL